MNFNRFVSVLAFFAVLSSPKAIAQTYELLNFGTQDGGEVEAAFFKADNAKVVIFAHGAIFDKESWYFLAEDFQRRGVAALSIDFRGYGNSTAGAPPKKCMTSWRDLLPEGAGLYRYQHRWGEHGRRRCACSLA